MLKQEIKSFIKPIRYKMLWQRILEKSLLVLFVVSVMLLVMSVLSHLIVVMYIERWMLAAAVLGGIIGLVWGLIRYPKRQEVLKTVDGLGYKERLITAWQFMDDQSLEANRQREDTMLAIRSNDYRKVYKIKWQPRRLVGLCLLAILAMGILSMDSPVRQATKDKEGMVEAILAEEVKLENLAKDFLEDEALPEELKDALADLLDELEDKLKEAKTEEEALKALSIAKDEVKKLDMADLKDQLEKMDAQMKAMSDNADEMAGKEDLKEEMKSLEEALKALEERGLEMDEAKALEEALEALEEAMASDDGEAIEQALEKASEMSEAAMEALKDAGAMSESMQAAINEAGKALSTNPTVSEMAFAASQEGQATEAVATQGSEATSGTQSQSEGEPTAAGAGEGSGQGQGSGQGSGQGTGAGSGSGQGQGAGQGTDSSNEDGGYKDGESGGGGWFQGEAKSENYEALYPPNRLGGESDPSFVQGNRSDGGDSQVQQVEGAPTMTGDLVSYKELYADYNKEAMQGVDDMEIPLLMKDLVKAYFSSLE